jgi:hypothetical protein
MSVCGFGLKVDFTVVAEVGGAIVAAPPEAVALSPAVVAVVGDSTVAPNDDGLLPLGPPRVSLRNGGLPPFTGMGLVRTGLALLRRPPIMSDPSGGVKVR